MQKARVTVLRGGNSREYDISLQSGAEVLQQLSKDVYESEDILISKDGTWHKNGVPIRPHDVLAHTDVVFNALHGHYGEDGKIQHLMEHHGVPFTGSTSIPAAFSMNRSLLKDLLKKEGIKSPYYHILNDNPGDEVANIFRTFSPPVVVKPVTRISSVEAAFAMTPALLINAVDSAFTYGDSVVLEEYIPGIEASVGVIDGYRGSELYVLPPVEISEKSDHKFPGNFTHDIKEKLGEIAQKVHKALGFRHYSRIDFVISPKRGIFVLEASALPALHKDSIFTKALHSVGAPLHHFLDHIIRLAIMR